jgi:hypothetical protein
MCSRSRASVVIVQATKVETHAKHWLGESLVSDRSVVRLFGVFITDYHSSQSPFRFLVSRRSASPPALISIALHLQRGYSCSKTSHISCGSAFQNARRRPDARTRIPSKSQTTHPRRTRALSFRNACTKIHECQAASQIRAVDQLQ